MALIDADFGTELVKQMADISPEFDALDSADQDLLGDNLGLAIARTFKLWFNGGTSVDGSTVLPGRDDTFGGDDSAGDTPDNITLTIT